VLSKILSELHDDTGAVRDPRNFYDGVEEISTGARGPVARAQFRRRGRFLREVGLTTPGGPSRDPLATSKILWSRPTCEVNGIVGGYNRRRHQDRVAGQGEREAHVPARGQGRTRNGYSKLSALS